MFKIMTKLCLYHWLFSNLGYGVRCQKKEPPNRIIFVLEKCFGIDSTSIAPLIRSLKLTDRPWTLGATFYCPNKRVFSSRFFRDSDLRHTLFSRNLTLLPPQPPISSYTLTTRCCFGLLVHKHFIYKKKQLDFISKLTYDQTSYNVGSIRTSSIRTLAFYCTVESRLRVECGRESGSDSHSLYNQTVQPGCKIGEIAKPDYVTRLFLYRFSITFFPWSKFDCRKLT